MKQLKIFSYFTILYLSYAQGQTNDNKTKPSVVEEIVRKVTNMTLKSLSQAPLSEKHKLLKIIEEKVNKSASAMGVDGHKYIKIIMHGVKLIAYNHTKYINQPSTTTEKETYIMRTHNSSEENFLNDEQTRKDQAIISIAAKIEKLANKYLKEAKTEKGKKYVIENIRKKVIETANRRHMMIYNKHDEIKSLSNLIAKGVDLIMKINLKNASKSINSEYFDNIGKKKTRRKMESFHKNMAVHNDRRFETSQCKFEIEQTCANIKSLNKLTCIYDKKVLPLEKLCDGIIHCLDRSDEQKCSEQAVEKIRKAERIIAKVDGSQIRKCILQKFNTTLITKQNDVLRSVLQSQLKFIEKYTYITPSQMQNPNNINIREKALRKTANEVALVVSSLGMALDGSLCTRRVGLDNVDIIANKYINDADPDKAFEELLKTQSALLRSCDCKGLYCSDSSCTEICKRICWQKYSLDRFSCRAVGDGPSVHLDTICDGKLDCYDESDETGCALGESYTKFEANTMYDNILKLLSTKTNSKEYHWILNELLTLRDTIKQLQNLSTKRNVEIINVKIIREQIFATITVIYDKYLRRGDEKSLNDIYDFLISLNEKLIGAMKRSRTGNDRIISSAGCYCTGTRCGLPNCSKLCVRACLVEPILTRYHCGNVKINYSIPIESLCDGKSSCPNGEDESGCNKDVCRYHHLVLLRHNLQDVGNKYKGTGLGEALTSWRTKVISTLMIAEKNDRPKPKVFRDIISNILHDLVMSYANFEEFRRNTNELTVKEFEKLSQQVIESIKTCGK